MSGDSFIQISVIIPCYNEERRLPHFLKDLIGYCRNSEYTYEIIVVDDGSSDQTSKVALSFREDFTNLSVLQRENNIGKGYTIREGFSKSRGDIVLFLDADGSTPPTEIESNLHFFKEGYDIVIGSRALHDQLHSVEAKFYRKWMGRIFSFLVHHLLIKDIKDTQCGFKMFRKEVIRPIFLEMKVMGFAFDLEVLYLAHSRGFKIKETPVNWHHVPGSKINLIKDSLKMFLDIFKIRQLHHIKNRINSKAA